MKPRKQVIIPIAQDVPFTPQESPLDVDLDFHLFEELTDGVGSSLKETLFEVLFNEFK